jgi:hypothetical protein
MAFRKRDGSRPPAVADTRRGRRYPTTRSFVPAAALPRRGRNQPNRAWRTRPNGTFPARTERTAQYRCTATTSAYASTMPLRQASELILPRKTSGVTTHRRSVTDRPGPLKSGHVGHLALLAQAWAPSGPRGSRSGVASETRARQATDFRLWSCLDRALQSTETRSGRGSRTSAAKVTPWRSSGQCSRCWGGLPDGC